MLYEDSQWSEDDVRKFFRGMKVIRNRQGTSLEELAEQTGLSYDELENVELGHDHMLTRPITDKDLAVIASALGYGVDDVISYG